MKRLRIIVSLIICTVTVVFISCKKKNTESNSTHQPTPPSTWPKLGNLNSLNSINSLYIDGANNLYAAGIVTSLTNIYNTYAYPTENVSKWNGTSWSQLGNLNADDVIFVLCGDTSGNVYAAGAFTDSIGSVNPVGDAYVAKWNGTSWSILGGKGALHIGQATITSMVYNSINNNIYIAVTNWITPGTFKVYFWNGTSWTVLGNAFNSAVNKLYVDKTGNLYACGYFTNTNGKCYVAKWDGSNWIELGTGSNALNANSYIWDIVSDATGNIYTAGEFHNASGKTYVAQWNGNNWLEVGGANALNTNGKIKTIHVDATGNIYAAGNFYYLIPSSGDYTGYTAKYNGTTWTTIGMNSLFATNKDQLKYQPGTIGFNNIIVNSTGTIYAVGAFTDINGNYYVGHYP